MLWFLQIENSDGVLVVGSSLEVFSAFRLIRRAIELRKPMAVLNLGETRLHRFSRDNDAASSSSQPALQPLLINADCEDVLKSVIL